MSFFRRGKTNLKSTVTNAIKSTPDLSQGLNSKSFQVSEIIKYGLNGTATTSSFDPIQSLLAIGTNNGSVHIFASGEMTHEFKPTNSTSNSAIITNLRFIKGVYLIATDSNSQISVYSLLQMKLLSQTSAPGAITCIETDPSQDWLWVGLQSGLIVCYDVDRGLMLVKYRIESQQRLNMPNVKTAEVRDIQWSTRDIGVLLITYSNLAVTYSLADQSVRNKFHYEVPADSPGGDGLSSGRARYPKFIKCQYHPNSLNMVSLHDDNSLVFWDTVTGTLIQARTISDINVNRASSQGSLNANASGINLPILDIKWCCDANPESTSLLIVGGGEVVNTITLLQFGHTPKYSLSSYEYMSGHYAHPKRQQTVQLQSSGRAMVSSVLLFTQTSPYFSSNHNPNLLMVWFTSGSFQILRFPSLQTLKNHANVLPQSLLWCGVHDSTTVEVQRNSWLGMISKDTRRICVLKGGIKDQSSLHLNQGKELRTGVVVSSAEDGLVALYDGSKAELEDSCALAVNVNDTLGTKDVGVVMASYASGLADLAVGTTEGDLILYRYAVNPNYDADNLSAQLQSLNLNTNQSVIDLRSRCPRDIKEGLLPMHLIRPTMVQPLAGQSTKTITALSNSNVHFLAVGYSNGDVLIIDRRGPAVIYHDSVIGNSVVGSSHVTSLKFSIMSFGDDTYSSVLLFAGTDKGEVFVYKVIPESNTGRFKGQLIDVVNNSLVFKNESIIGLHPIKSESGTPCVATTFDFGQLSSGVLIKGLLVVQTHSGLAIYEPGKGKALSCSKSFKGHSQIITSGVTVVGLSDPGKVSVKGYAACVTAVCNDGMVRFFTLPDLKEITGLNTGYQTSNGSQFAGKSSVLASGDVLIRTSEHSSVLISVVPSQHRSSTTIITDKFFVESRHIPSRPVLSGTQWFKGETIITSSQLESLLRPSSSSTSQRRESTKTAESQISASIINHNLLPFTIPTSPTTSSQDRLKQTPQDLQYTAPHRGRTHGGYDPSRYVYRQFTEGVDSIGDAVDNYVSDVNKRVQESIKGAKEDLVRGVIKSKFGV